jgi:pimeloyl-ACP methyl ester carboxylesterase
MQSPEPWFAKALAQEPVIRTVPAGDGCLSMLHWPRPGAPTLILLHAAAANAHWWRFTAPFLARHHDVIALDFSGHGSSSWRATYSLEGWAEDVLTVIRALDLHRPLIVGHSLGGRVGLILAAESPASIAGLVMVDSAVYPPGDEIVVWQWPQGYRPPIFPDRETAIGRYALIPLQRTVSEPIRRFLAAGSLRETPAGVTWQFDPAITTLGTREAFAQALLPRAKGSTALIYGEDSEIVPPATVAHMAAHLGGAPVIGIPAAGHHVFVDQPLAFVTALRGLLATWPPGC